MFRRIVSLLAVLMLLAASALSESVFTKLYTAGESGDALYDGILLADGGILLAGHTYTVSTNYCDALAIRLDADGNALWQVHLCENENTYEYFSQASELPDGRFALIYCFGNGMVDRYELILVDDEGQIAERIAPPEGIGVVTRKEDTFETLRWSLLDDGILAIDRVALDEDGYTGLTTLTRLDFDGNVIWQREYPDMEPWTPTAVYQDGTDLLFCGPWRPGIAFSGCVLRMDADGNMLWKYADPEPTMFQHLDALCVLPDGGIAGNIAQWGIDDYEITECFVVRLDAEGNELWTQPVESKNGMFDGICVTDNGILLYNAQDELALLDFDGNTLWTQPPNNTYQGETNRIRRGPDGELYAFGSGGDGLIVSKVTLPAQ